MQTAVATLRRDRQFRRAIILLSALTALILATPFSRAGAQGILPRMPILALTYTDAQGPAQMLITPGGPDASVSGIDIEVVLTQHGNRFTGGGFAHELGNDAFVVGFTLVSPEGFSFFLSGELYRDANHWEGGGRVRFAANHTTFDTWTVTGAPLIGPRIGDLLPVGVTLDPIAGDAPHAAAVLIPLPEGETRIVLDLADARPGATYSAALHAGTCAQPSASFTALTALTTGDDGAATASGLVRFRDTEDIPLTDLVDGERIIIISGDSGPVACGVIPALAPNLSR